MNTEESSNSNESASFAEIGQTHKNGNIIQELFGFLGDNKKWWLLPIIICLLLVGAIILLGAGGGAPFIYTLF